MLEADFNSELDFSQHQANSIEHTKYTCLPLNRWPGHSFRSIYATPLRGVSGYILWSVVCFSSTGCWYKSTSVHYFLFSYCFSNCLCYRKSNHQAITWKGPLGLMSKNAFFQSGPWSPDFIHTAESTEAILLTLRSTLSVPVKSIHNHTHIQTIRNCQWTKTEYWVTLNVCKTLRLLKPLNITTHTWWLISTNTDIWFSLDSQKGAHTEWLTGTEIPQSEL